MENMEKTIQSRNMTRIQTGKHIGLIECAKKVCPGFVFDENNFDITDQMLLYFESSDEFRGSLRKGIMIGGSVGCGKTTLFRLFQKYTELKHLSSWFSICTSREIERAFVEKGYPGLELFGWNKLSNEYNVMIQHPYHLAIDDVGLEMHATNYGNTLDPFSEVMLDRYEMFIEKGIKTHLTTNLPKGELAKRYSPRLISRMKEMFNVFYLKGEDRRK